MRRREFLHICSITGAGLLCGLPAHSAEKPRKPVSGTRSTRRWMTGSARTGCASYPVVNDRRIPSETP